MLNCIVVMGRPGSGKSEIGKRVATLTGWHYISTGDLARRLIEDKEWLRRGDLAPEEDLRDLFKAEYEARGAEGCVIDGMPRTVDQVGFLLDLIPAESILAAYVDVPVFVAYGRLRQRGREDDIKDEVLYKRMGVYEEHTVPALLMLTSRCHTVMLDGLEPPDRNARRLVECVFRGCKNGTFAKGIRPCWRS